MVVQDFVHPLLKMAVGGGGKIMVVQYRRYQGTLLVARLGTKTSIFSCGPYMSLFYKELRIDDREKGTLVLTSLLEDIVKH